MAGEARLRTLRDCMTHSVKHNALYSDNEKTDQKRKLKREKGVLREELGGLRVPRNATPGRGAERRAGPDYQ